VGRRDKGGRYGVQGFTQYKKRTDGVNPISWHNLITSGSFQSVGAVFRT
jgi:hypothetical protein